MKLYWVYSIFTVFRDTDEKKGIAEATPFPTGNAHQVYSKEPN